MGDSIDNIKGVPGIGEKGARDLIATYGVARRAARARGRGPAEEVPRGAARRTPTTRGSSRELLRIRTDVPVRLRPRALQYRGASRERCFELFSRLGFRSLTMEYAPTAETVGEAVRRRDDDRGARRAGVGARAAPDRFALHVLPDGPSPVPRRIAGLAFSTGRPARLVRAARSRAPCSATAA